MKKTPDFLNDKVLLNVLANSIENAKAIYEACEGHVVVGLLSKNYPLFGSLHNATYETYKVLGGFALGLPHTATYFGQLFFSLSLIHIYPESNISCFCQNCLCF